MACQCFLQMTFFFCRRHRVWEVLVNDVITSKRHGGKNQNFRSRFRWSELYFATPWSNIWWQFCCWLVSCWQQKCEYCLTRKTVIYLRNVSFGFPQVTLVKSITFVFQNYSGFISTIGKLVLLSFKCANGISKMESRCRNVNGAFIVTCNALLVLWCWHIKRKWILWTIGNRLLITQMYLKNLLLHSILFFN